MRHTDGQTYSRTGIDRQADRQADGQTDRWPPLIP